MKLLTPQQIEQLRQPFDKVGAFNGFTQEKVEQILNDVAQFYIALARINLRIRETNKPK